MSTCKISYNGNEISAVDEAAPVSVAYNNATIATINDGDTKTLGCHGKVMASDVVIGSKTLNCNGKLMRGDIIVELVGSATSGETWYFNDNLLPNSKGVFVVNFTSNGVAYTKMMKRNVLINSLMNYENSEGVVKVYDSRSTTSWVNEVYRTIVLDEPATGDFLAFLEANATKIS